MTISILTSGVITNGITLGKGDFLYVSSGGVADNTVVNSKGNVVVSSGGRTTGTEVNANGTETVYAGGCASATVVGPRGTQIVNAGGTANATVISNGNAHVAGDFNFAVLSAGNEYVSSGGVASANVVSARGKLFVFSAAESVGTVLTGGYEYVFSSGVASATQVDSGGVVEVDSGSEAFGTVVSTGGQETVFSGGVAYDSIVSGGGSELVFGEVSGAVIDGAQNVYPGGVASGVVLNSGANQLVSSGGTVSATTVNDGAEEMILNGGSVGGTVLKPGGTIDLPDLAYGGGGSAILDPLTDVLTVTEGGSSYALTLSGLYPFTSFAALPDSGLGTQITIAQRTLEWNGALGTDFSNPLDWIDLSNDLAAVLGPTVTDTVEFLTGGGAITGTGLAGQLRFGGSTSWNLTAGASLSATADVTVGEAGDSELLINAGATINGLGAGDDISGVSGGAGSVTVDGTGSMWRSVGELVVGDLGTGVLTVTDAGGVSAAAAAGSPAMAVGAGGGDGSVLVSGPGSRATFTGEVDVGQAGAGTLTVANQGTMLTGDDAALDPAQGFDIGQLGGASGYATVTGLGSLLNNVGRFIVGDAGLGSLSIAAGATVDTTPGSVPGLAGLVIANTASASGASVNVTGAGSDLAITGTAVVGNAGSGALSVSQGATVTAGALDLAAGATGDGVVSVVGVGSSLTVTGPLIVGDQAAGEFSVLGGAHVTIGGGLVGGTGASAAGNLDIEGAGSVFTINAGSLVVGATGPAEFTLGIGATLKGQLATDQFGVTNLYGNVDPQTDPVDGIQNVGFNNSLVYDFYVDNSGTINVESETATFYTPLATFETNAANGSTTGVWQIGAKDTLVMNATSVDSSQTFDLTSTVAATLVIGQVPEGDINNLDTLNGMTTPTLTGSIAAGAANVLPGWAAPIENYQSGDVIILRGLTYASATASGDVVTMWDGVGGTGNALGSLTFIDKSGGTTSVAALAEATAAAAQINTLACFAAGTRIATESGWVAVDELRVGDRVRTVLGGRASPPASSAGPTTSSPGPTASSPGPTASSPGSSGGPDARTVPGRVPRTSRGMTGGDRAAGGDPMTGGTQMTEKDAPCAPIVWIGSRTIDCARHLKPETVWPVRIARGAFGGNVPVRELFVSPDHAIYLDGVLIPAKLLVNGTSITRVERSKVTYYHVELPEHAVILAEGLPAESYLDTGDRANFAGNGTIRLVADFAARLAPETALLWEAKAAAPLVMSGPRLEAARRAIAAPVPASRPRPRPRDRKVA